MKEKEKSGLGKPCGSERGGTEKAPAVIVLKITCGEVGGESSGQPENIT